MSMNVAAVGRLGLLVRMRQWLAVRSSGRGLLPFAALAVLLVIAYRDLAFWNPGRPLVDEAGPLYAPSDTAPLFVYAVSFILLCGRRARIRAALAEARPSPYGALGLAPSLALYAWAQHTGAVDLLLVSFIGVVLGGAAVSGGRRLAGSIALPAVFLLFAYPLPAVLTNQLVHAFQAATTTFTTLLLEGLGTNPVREGDMIYVRGRIFQVIESCSGLRLADTLFMAGVIFGDVLCRRRLHTVVILLLAVPLAFLLNCVRVLTIVYFPTSEASPGHTAQGIGVLVFGILLFAVVERVLTRWLPPEDRAPERTMPGSRGIRPVAIWLLVGAMLIVAATPLWLPRWLPPRAPADWDVAPPIRWDGWKARKLPTDSVYLGSVAYTRHFLRRYERDGVSVDLFMGRDDRLWRDRSALSAKNALPGSGWAVYDDRRVRFDWAPGEVREVLAGRRGQQVLSFQWYEGTKGLGGEAVGAVLALDNSFLRMRDPYHVVRLTTPVETEPGSRSRARERLERFARLVRSSLDGGG